MRDRYIYYSDGTRRFVSDLSVAELRECLDMLGELVPVDGTDCTRDEIKERIHIELIARGLTP